jgi:hypothetical protein
MAANFAGRTLLFVNVWSVFVPAVLDDFLHYNFKFVHDMSIVRLLCGHF